MTASAVALYALRRLPSIVMDAAIEATALSATGNTAGWLMEVNGASAETTDAGRVNGA